MSFYQYLLETKADRTQVELVNNAWRVVSSASTLLTASIHLFNYPIVSPEGKLGPFQG